MSGIGIFGGSFNPPHLGHLRAAQFFADALALERVLVIPAGEAPLKAAPRGASAEARLRLCELTFSVDSRFAVDATELRRPGASYTVDTLRALCAQDPGQACYLLIGTDQLERFTQWNDWRGILRLCTLCVLQRDAAPLRLPPELPQDRVRLLTGFEPLEISSTQVRAVLAYGEDVSPWLAPAALQYIRQKGLYTDRPLPERETAHQWVARVLSPERLFHSQCVAEAAEALALQYGAEPERAWLAGMLHDCMKLATLEEKRELCARYGKPLLPEEESAAQVWHAFAGEAWLALECGVTDPAILSAVRWHCTGHADMTLLDQVVFVADLISADRHYPDVEQVRSLAARSLDEASLYILNHIFAKLKQSGRQSHPASIAWQKELISKQTEPE